jgi:hypothetical protein
MSCRFHQKHLQPHAGFLANDRARALAQPISCETKSMSKIKIKNMALTEPDPSLLFNLSPIFLTPQ